MSENMESDHFGDGWLSKWEDQCSQDWESESNMEDRIQRENERSTQKLWTTFQNSATTIAELYKEGCHENCVSLWLPFQNSASSLTKLYKDGVDAMRRGYELGGHVGHHRRTRDVLAWAKKRRRHIRRDELVAFLCGRPAPARAVRGGASGGVGVGAGGWVGGRGAEWTSPRLQPTPDEMEERDEPDLQPFQDALALQGLNGAMSNVSMRHGGVDGVGGGGGGGLHCFIIDEMRRRAEGRKRTGGTADGHESPGRKRTRLF